MRQMLYAGFLLAAFSGLMQAEEAKSSAAEAPKIAPVQATPEAVAAAEKKALEYLVKEQKADGSFGPMQNVGFTGLCVNALSVGDPKTYTPDNEVIRKAVAYILSQQQRDGSIAEPTQGYINYKTSVAIWALSSLDKNRYKEAIEKAKKYTLLLQADEANGYTQGESLYYGGIGYGGEPKPDLSNLQFALEALKEAGVPAENEVWKKALVFIGRSQNLTSQNDLAQAEKFEVVKQRNYKVGNDGGFTYGPMESKPDRKLWKNADGSMTAPSYGSMTYAGLKSMIYAGLSKNDPRVQGAMRFISKNWTLDLNPGLGQADKPDLGQQGLYYYYMTMAKALDAYGEKEIVTSDGVKHDWATELLGAILARQKADGSWINEKDRWEEGWGVVVTSYSLIAIEICKKAQAKPVAAEKKSEGK